MKIDTPFSIHTAPLSQMGMELLAATGLVTLCVIVHGLGLVLLTRMIKPANDPTGRHLPPVSFRGVLITLMIVLTLFVLHGLEVWIFAAFYLLAEALPDLESALYYSTISYSTVGYDDSSVGKDWRLVGALESITGIILLGWSTAYFVRILSRIEAR